MRNYIRYLIYLYVFIGFIYSYAGSYEDFFRAVKRDDAEEVLDLLQRGFDPNAPDPYGQEALVIALNEPSERVLEVLLTWPKIKLDQRNANDETPLMLACLHGQMAAVKKLLERDADVNKVGWAPLHYAATGGHPQIIQLLLDQHAYIDAESPNGTTPLMMAAMYGSPEAIQLLLDAGADPSLKNQLGMDALAFARKGERVDAQAILEAIQPGKVSENPSREAH